MTRFSIDIVSDLDQDTVCPWCYVGYRKLNRAITEFSASNPGHIFDITWKPYYLNPNSPKVGIDKTEFYYSKFGAERVVPMFQRLSAIGEAEGIHFKFGGKTGNTRDSHRLIQMAKEKGLQTRMVEELFAAYFENEKDITSFETLLDAAKKAGLEEDEVKGWLGSDAGGDVVDREVHVAQRHGISGVPNFTINGRYEIGGAQDPREFIAVFKGLADASTPVTTGMTC